MRRALPLVLLLACSAEPSSPPPGPAAPPCAEGYRLDEGGACVVKLPAQACPAGTMAKLGSEACVPLGPTCGPGFAPHASGWGCAEVAAASCAPGAMPVLGQADCAPVGFVACPAGFARDASGWFCAPLVASGCTGATRRAVGSASCLPAGDCAAAFPPAGATYFVDAALAPASADATHVTTIGAAVARAPAGAVIAVAPGTYVETVQPARAVALVGQCPAKVVWRPAAGQRRVLVAKGVRGVEARGFTFADGAVSAELGGEVTVEDSASQGAYATAFIASDSSAAGPSTVRVRRVVVRDVVAPSGLGLALYVLGDALIEARDLDVDGATGSALVASDDNGRSARGKLTVDGLVVSRVGADGSGVGRALDVRGGEVAVKRALVVGGSGAAVSAVGTTSDVALTDFVVRDVVRAKGAGGGALQAEGGARVSLERGAVVDTEGGGVHARGAKTTVGFTDVTVLNRTVCPTGCTADTVLEGSALTWTRTAVVGNHAGGLFVGKSARATLESTRISATRGEWVGTQFVSGVGVAVDTQGSLAMTGSAVDGCDLGGLAVNGGVAVLRQSLLSANRGGGVSVREAGNVRVEGSALRANLGFNVGVYGPQAPGAAAKAASYVEVVGSVLRAGVTRATVDSGVGAFVAFGGALVLEQTSVSDNHLFGVAASDAGTHLVISRSVVGQTKESGAGDFGSGVSVTTGAALELSDSAVVDDATAGVQVTGTLAPRAVLRDCRIDGIRAASGAFGLGLSVGPGAAVAASGLDLSRAFAVGVGIDGGALTLARSVVADTNVGLHAAGATALEQRASLPDVPEPGKALVDGETQFVRVGARFGAGDLALPPAYAFHGD